MNDPAVAIWREVCDRFARLRGERARELWLDASRPSSFRRGLFLLDLPNDATKAAVDGRYTADLESCFREVTGSPVRVRTRVHDEPAAEADTRPPRPRTPAELRHAREVSAPTTSTFVRHDANGLATRAVENFADPSQPYSLLFVHGPAGSGKTALGRHALRLLRAQGLAQRPVVLSGEALTEDVGRAARRGAFGTLHDDWRGADLVILDEAHRLRGRKRTQREALTMLVNVLESGGRVLVLSRHPAREIHVLDRRLQSYLDGCMAVELHAPSRPDREAVLAAAAESLPLDVDGCVVPALATRCAGTLTDAIDVLNRAAARASRAGVPLALAAVERHLTHAEEGGPANFEALLRAVSERYDVSIERLRSSEKARDVAAARHLCIYIASRSLGFSAREVARHMRLQSPSVLAYARRRVEARRADDPAFDAFVRELQSSIEGAQRDLEL